MKNKVEQHQSFRSCIKDLYHNDLIKTMKNIEHHKGVSCFEHCVKVSYISYKIAKKYKLDYVSAARGGFLHDFYLYDWHEKGSHKGLHGFNHSKIALKNAQAIADLNKREIDIITKHMWPLNPMFPRYKESWVVTLVDKMTALKEVFHVGKSHRKHK